MEDVVAKKSLAADGEAGGISLVADANIGGGEPMMGDGLDQDSGGGLSIRSGRATAGGKSTVGISKTFVLG